jgi:hypothetical protein
MFLSVFADYKSMPLCPAGQFVLRRIKKIILFSPPRCVNSWREKKSVAIKKFRLKSIKAGEIKTMKKRFWKTIRGTALAILVLTMFAQISVFAQDIEDQNKEQARQKDASTQRATAKALVGTWDTQVTLRVCQTGAAINTFATIRTFMSGGTTIGSNASISPALRTPEYGVWEHLSGRTFRLKFKSFSFDPMGNPTGWSIVTQTAEVSPDGNSYTTVGPVEVYVPNGALVFTGCATATATRFE